jgi:hypothetical protein
MTSWRRLGAKYVCQYRGRAADPKKEFARLVRAVFLDKEKEIVRHTFHHMAATWLVRGQADKFEAAGSLGMMLKTLESTYGHHPPPDHQSSAGAAFSKRRTKAA